MTTPKIMLCTLCLNEMEWLPNLFKQHRSWPGLVHWCFVEGVDREYERANPDMVRPGGLSVDNTTVWLDLVKARDELVSVVRPGVSDCGDAAQNKCALRQAYLDMAEKVKPDYIIILDADEFYTRNHQELIPVMMKDHNRMSYIFHRREIWRPPVWKDQPLMGHEVVGGFWKIPCCHWWKWVPGMRYGANHNTPESEGRLLITDCHRFDLAPGPQMIHMGFAALEKTRIAKNAYYAGRGEAADPKRSWYVDSRGMWATWKPGVKLPQGARVIPYSGPIPECFENYKETSNA